MNGRVMKSIADPATVKDIAASMRITLATFGAEAW